MTAASPLPSGGASPFIEEVQHQSDLADAALAQGDIDTTIDAMLAIDTQMHEWSADTLDSDEQDQARSVLRRHLVRLGAVAHEGTADPRARIAPLVERVLQLRRELRGDGQYAVADRLRDALVEAGVAIHDTPQGTSWDLADAGARQPPRSEALAAGPPARPAPAG